MGSVKSRYLRVFEKTQGKSLDPERGAIYLFKKHCRRCRAGLTLPKRWDKNVNKKLYRSSYCSLRCREIGKTEIDVHVKGKANRGFQIEPYPIEELAFLSIQIKKENPIKRIVFMAKVKFKLISEQLGFLEMETGKRWNLKKLKYWS